MSAATVHYGYKVLLQRLEGMGSWIELRAMPSHYGCSARGLRMLKSLSSYSPTASAHTRYALFPSIMTWRLCCPLWQVHFGMCERRSREALSSYIQVSLKEPWDACVNVGVVNV